MKSSKSSFEFYAAKIGLSVACSLVVGQCCPAREPELIRTLPRNIEREEITPGPERTAPKSLPSAAIQKTRIKQSIIPSDERVKATTQDEWLVITGLQALSELGLEGKDAKAENDLKKAIEYIKLHLQSRPFARLRPHKQASNSDYWTARGGAYQLVNLYQAYENGPASCMATLLPPPGYARPTEAVNLNTVPAKSANRQLQLQDKPPLPEQERDDKPIRWKPVKIERPKLPKVMRV